MDTLVPIINRIHEALGSVDSNALNIPQIVTVGMQSSGKSSVIENIVRKDFLPRGKTLTTRRPIKIHLTKTTQEQEWAEFTHIPNRKIHDFREVRTEIEKETRRICGKGSAISHIPISLRIFSPNVFNLLLIDLPGLTKIPIDDQPSDIEAQTREMIFKFISNKNCIILAIIPANVDIANSEPLKIAREVDVDGDRTIGVVTKTDIMDAGTNAVHILNNTGAFKLRHGFVAVVCRSQKHTDDNETIAQALAREKAFFAQTAAYNTVSTACGTENLFKMLSDLLLRFICKSIPSIRTQIADLIIKAKKELAAYGDIDAVGEVSNSALLLNIITMYVGDFTKSINGDTNINTGVRINHIFAKTFPRLIEDAFVAGCLTVEHVKAAIDSSNGARPYLFVPELAFEHLAKQQISLLKVPASQCVQLVLEQVSQIAMDCIKNTAARFPALAQSMRAITAELINEKIAKTIDMVDCTLEMEHTYLNTNHPDFVKSEMMMQAITSVFEARKGDEAQLKTHTTAASESSFLNLKFFRTLPPTPDCKNKPQLQTVKNSAKNNVKADFGDEQDRLEICLIYSLVSEYAKIVRKSITDSVPKCLMHFFVKAVTDSLHNRLVMRLFKAEVVDSVMVEDESVVRARSKHKTRLASLQSAMEMIGELRIFDLT